MSVLIGTATAKVVSELINNGKIRQARKRADARISNDAWFLIEDANFFYWYGKAVKLTDHDRILLIKIRMYMQKCSHFRTTMNDIDWLIDDAQYAIGKHDLGKAEKILNDAFSIKNENHNRLSAITSLRGRVAYLRGDFSLALNLHREAEKRWPDSSFCDATEATYVRQWKAENRFYALKAMVANGTKKAYRRVMTDFVIGGDSNWRIAYPGDKSRVIRLRARLINSGRLGNMIDDLIMRLFV